MSNAVIIVIARIFFKNYNLHSTLRGGFVPSVAINYLDLIAIMLGWLVVLATAGDFKIS